MEQKLLAFIQQCLGLANTGNTDDNRGQCTGLVMLWLAAHNLGNIWGNAVDLLHNAPQPPYTVVANTPTNFPAIGNIVCWDSTWGGGFGHTGIVLAANELWLVTFEQNDPVGSPPIVSTHNYNGIEGWIVLP